MRTFIAIMIMVYVTIGASYAQNSNDFRTNPKYQKAMANIPNLSEEQQTQIDAFITEFMTETEPIQSELSNIREKESAANTSADVMSELAKKRDALTKKVLDARKGLEERVSSILTPAQLEKLKTNSKSE